MSRKLRFRSGGSPLEIAYERRGDRIALASGVEGIVKREGVWSDVTLGDRAIRCAVARGRRGIWVSCQGRTWLLEEERRDASAQGAPSADELRAPMTGRVVQVAAKPGAQVAEGELLVTIEAMKMEFKLVAPEDGAVKEVRAAAGDRVELGDLLVVLEPKP